MHPFRAGSGWRLFFFAVTALGLVACRPAPPPLAAGATLRVSQRNEPATLDPAMATLPDEFFVLRALLEGLVTPDPDGGLPRAAAAESWSISPDGRTYTFRLRPDGRWSDGSPVVAGDFVASYRRLLTPTTAAAKPDRFFHVKGAEDYYRGRLTDFSATGFRAVDSLTLEIELTHPAPEFLVYVASGPWLPVHGPTVERFGAQWTRPGNFVGNGPFTLSAWDPNQRVVLTRRDDHWDAAHYPLGRIQFVALDNGDAEERAFRTGQVDVTMSVPVHRIPAYRADQPARVRSLPLHETRYLSFNLARGPLNDVRVRQALSLAIDRDALVRAVLQGGQTTATSLVPPGLGGYVPPESPRGTYDDARRLLAAAGYPEGRGFPRLTLSTWTNVPVLEAIQQMWRTELGIQVDLVQREARVHLAALRSGDYDIGFITAIPDVADPAAILAEFRTGAAGNHPQWSSPAFDRALANAAGTNEPSPAVRLDRLAAAERLLLADQPVAPLYFNARTFLVSPAVRGWQEDGLWTRFYRGVDVVAPTPEAPPAAPR